MDVLDPAMKTMNKRIIGYAVIAVAVALSLLPERAPEPEPEPAGSGADRSYWEYALPDLTEATGGTAACPAFFDDDPRTEAQPEAPAVTAFDEAVLRACGPRGGRVTEAEFEALVADHREVLAAALPAAWRALPEDARLARLKQTWLGHRGFDHVFCGEWEKGTIGGLHFRGRFLQLQVEGSACRLPSDKQEIEPGQIYGIGVVSAEGDFRHPIKSYALNQTALDLLRLGTGTAAACCRAGSDGWAPYRSWRSKVLHVPTAEGGPEIVNRVICRADNPADSAGIGLVTLHADATPDPSTPFCGLP